MNRVTLLDHGYLEIVETWGSDERIIEAARMSTQKGFEGWGPRCPHGNEVGRCLIGLGWCDDAAKCNAKPGDEKLLRYLYENHHTTPFEMAGAVIEVQAPIFVFREWHRHRTQSFNEMSARYAPLPDLNYIPTVERLMRNAGSNKQAQSTGVELDEGFAGAFRCNLERLYDRIQRVYEDALNDGVPKELARLCLPVGRYSRMRASANLLNWMRFIGLRSSPKAQEEIRVYSDALRDELAKVFPRTMALFAEKPF